MKTYTVLYAEDVPHYGFETIEAEDAAAAIEAAKRLDFSQTATDPEYNNAVCSRIVHIECEDGTIIAEALSLDDCFLRNGGESARLLCDAAPQLLAVLQTFIARADDLIAAIDGVTGQFETEVAALSAAATEAEAAVKAAKGGAA